MDKPNRLYEYKVKYMCSTDNRPGTHFYMCGSAAEALRDHAGVCLLKHRHLQILSVWCKNPWTHEWTDETQECEEQINALNKLL